MLNEVSKFCSEGSPILNWKVQKKNISLLFHFLFSIFYARKVTKPPKRGLPDHQKSENEGSKKPFPKDMLDITTLTKLLTKLIFNISI